MNSFSIANPNQNTLTTIILYPFSSPRNICVHCVTLRCISFSSIIWSDAEYGKWRWAHRLLLFRQECRTFQISRRLGRSGYTHFLNRGYKAILIFELILIWQVKLHNHFHKTIAVSRSIIKLLCTSSALRRLILCSNEFQTENRRRPM